MNAVWNSYGQLCGCPEIFKKSCKFFCRELDIRVLKYMTPVKPKRSYLNQRGMRSSRLSPRQAMKYLLQLNLATR